jgi:hypothetical protein
MPDPISVCTPMPAAISGHNTVPTGVLTNTVADDIEGNGAYCS